MKAAELEVLFTANTDDVAKAEKDVKSAGQRIEKQKTTAKVDANAKPALEGMESVETAAKKLVSQKTVATIDANIEKAAKATDSVKERLDYLRSVETDLDVKADISRAEANLQRMQRNLDALRSARTKVEIDADTSSADKAIGDLADTVGDAGDDAGSKFSGSVISALATIPIAGAVVGVGVAIGQALADGVRDGLQQEVSRDRLQALTGITEAEAAAIGRTSSEAYANGFGDSIEQNMNTARLGLQFDLIDPQATNRDSQKVIEGIAGIADVLEEDVQPVAKTVTQLLRTGLAASAQDAFDILATGAREGVNLGEDLLDTLGEYGSTFAALGFTGGQTLGILNQGLKAGAPNTDFFADSLRELGIRLRDGDDATSGFVEQLGLVPSELQAAFVNGGPEAGAALDELFDKLRDTDPLTQNAVAVGLLGTQYEDLQFDLSTIDLSNAEEQLNGVQGSAQRMFDTLASNDASKIEGALRSIEVAGDAVKGALAGAFGDGLGQLATFVTENRGPVLQFLSDLIDGGIDFGQAIIESVAGGTEALGEFVSGAGVDILKSIGQVMYFLGHDTSGLEEVITDMESFDEKTSSVADNVRQLSGNLEDGRDQFHDFFDPQIDIATLSDTTLALASAVDTVGVSVETGAPLVDAYTRATDGSVQANAALEGQIRASIGALGEQIGAAAATGESQSALRGRFDEGTAALVNQLTQMGLTEQEARDLIATYGAVPSLVETAVTADTSQAYAATDAYLRYVNSRSATITVNATNPNIGFGLGDGRANGGAIYGPGGPRDDKAGLFRLSNGEHVLDSEDVRRMGGQAAVYRFRQMLDSGGFQGFADGGQVAVPASTWQVGGSSPAVLERTIVERRMTQQTAAPAAPAAQLVPNDRPILMDGRIFGVLREQANGDASIIVNEALQRYQQNARRGSWNALSMNGL
ncbi:phage tail tape measure protein [Rathayibacter festucae]|uniref:Phage tail tape measure protein domain-containing protein n=1 Tax=Rathayibacter festucae DSM 15932 TaxID=1328866 RepID=A0A3Q9UX77_9MICO|nr:phage tail tape measure protein [Rathayibacter festucae]AZZ52620.1 hypothetical protein C1I64_11595 [Rathayibacter festucae DSM 15932]